jgi:hypothetical protein
MSNKDVALRKAQKRVAMLLSYDKLVKVCHVKQPITAAQFATMDNGQVMRACKDLYNRATVKQVKRLQAMMLPREPVDVRLWVNALMARVWLRWFHVKMSVKRVLKPLAYEQSAFKPPTEGLASTVRKAPRA